MASEELAVWNQTALMPRGLYEMLEIVVWPNQASCKIISCGNMIHRVHIKTSHKTPGAINNRQTWCSLFWPAWRTLVRCLSKVRKWQREEISFIPCTVSSFCTAKWLTPHCNISTLSSHKSAGRARATRRATHQGTEQRMQLAVWRYALKSPTALWKIKTHSLLLSVFTFSHITTKT